jgi:DNA repair protein RadB
VNGTASAERRVKESASVPRSMAPDRQASGVASIDVLLGGGLETDGLTELYGEGGSGKSLFCLQAAATVTRDDRWVLYIDTEGLSVDRISSISNGQPERMLERMLLTTPKSLAEQSKAVRTAGLLARDGSRPVGLIVLDSATFFYRLSLSQSDEDEARQALGAELADLVATSIAVGIPVVFTNQVWRNVQNGTLEPLGGSFVNHVAKTILRFEKRPGSRRRVVLVKHRSLPEAATEFTITSSGLE